MRLSRYLPSDPRTPSNQKPSQPPKKVDRFHLWLKNRKGRQSRAKQLSNSVIRLLTKRLIMSLQESMTLMKQTLRQTMHFFERSRIWTTTRDSQTTTKKRVTWDCEDRLSLVARVSPRNWWCEDRRPMSLVSTLPLTMILCPLISRDQSTHHRCAWSPVRHLSLFSQIKAFKRKSKTKMTLRIMPETQPN